jgi:hypothetical protein
MITPIWETKAICRRRKQTAILRMREQTGTLSVTTLASELKYPSVTDVGSGDKTSVSVEEIMAVGADQG